MTVIVRLLLALVLLALVAFCAFGFLATFEPLDRSTQVTWRLIHGFGGGLCLLGAGWLAWPRKRN